MSQSVSEFALEKTPEYPDVIEPAELDAAESLSATDEPIPFDVDAIRADFPILERTAGEHPLVYLDLSLIHISEPTRPY